MLGTQSAGTGPSDSDTRAGVRAALRAHPVRLALSVLAAILVLVPVILLTTPLFDAPIDVRPDPTTSYAEAMERARALEAADGPDVADECRSRVLGRGERTERAVVLLHGFTNCPAQFALIAQAYADAGYNVVVPRLPGHGERDRLTTALSDFTVGDVVDVGDTAVDIAAGLGDEVVAVGLSGGGTLAGWLARERDEVSEAVLLAPLVVPKVLPEIAVAPVSRAFRYVPDLYWWWDGDQKEALATPPYAYPRYSLRSIGAFLALGRAIQTDSPRTTTLERLVVVTNENDAAISNAAVGPVAEALSEGDVDVTVEVLPESLGYRHDLVSPEGENADDLEAIYARLGPLLGLPDLAAVTR